MSAFAVETPQVLYTLDPVPGTPGDKPVALAVGDGLIVTANETSSNLTIIDDDHFSGFSRILGSISLSDPPSDIVHHEFPTGVHRFYAASNSSQTITSFTVDDQSETRLVLENTVSTAGNPYRMAVDDSAHKLYAASVDQVEVFDINPSSPTFFTRIAQIPDAKALNVVVNSGSHTIYGASGSTGEIYKIDGTTDTISDTFTLGWSVMSLAVNTDNTELYAAGLSDTSVHVLSVTGAELASIPATGGNMISELVYVSRDDTNSVYVMEPLSSGVEIFDPETRQMSGSYFRTSAFYGIDYDPSQDTVYYANQDWDSVTIEPFDGVEMEDNWTETLPLTFTPIDVKILGSHILAVTGYHPQGGVVVFAGYPASPMSLDAGFQLYGGAYALEKSPDDDKVWVTNSASGEIAEISYSSSFGFDYQKTAHGTIGIRSIKYVPTVDKIYIASISANKIFVYDADLNDTGVSIVVSAGPTDMEWSQSLDRLYVPCSVGQTVNVIDPQSNSVVLSAPLSCSPQQAAINTAANTLYVSCQESSGIVALDLGSGAVTHTLPLAYTPGDVLYSAGAGTLYVTDHSGDALVMLDPVTWTERARVPIGGDGRRMALDSANSLIWVTVENAGIVVGVYDNYGDLTPPSAPTGLEIFPDHANDRDRLFWTANSEPDLAGYNVYLADQQAGPYTKLNLTGIVTQNQYFHSPAQSTDKWYRVTAVDANDNESAPGTAKSVPVVLSDAVELEQGWNMVGIRRELPPVPVSEIFGTARVFDLQGDDYVEIQTASQLEPGRAYWFKSDSVATVQISGPEPDTAQNSVSGPGWVPIGLIGSISGHGFDDLVQITDSGPPAQDQTFYAASVMGLIGTIIYAWDPDLKQYSYRTITPDLVPWVGGAYWIQVKNWRVTGYKILSP